MVKNNMITNAETRLMLRMVLNTPLVVQNIRDGATRGMTSQRLVKYLRARTRSALRGWMRNCDDPFVRTAVKTAVDRTVDWHAIVVAVLTTPENQ